MPRHIYRRDDNALPTNTRLFWVGSHVLIVQSDDAADLITSLTTMSQEEWAAAFAGEPYDQSGMGE